MSTKKVKHAKVVTLNPALAREAVQVDQQLRQQWGAFKLARRAFGGICLRIKAHKLHRFIDNPKSRKHYVSMWQYVRNVTNGEVSRATMFTAMKIAKLTKGPHAIPAKVVDAMPIGNAAKVAQIPAHKRTLQLVKKAQHEAPAKFAATAQKASGKKASLVTFSVKLHPLVSEKLKKAITSFRSKAEGNLTVDDVAVIKLVKAAEAGKKVLAEQATINASVKKIEAKKAVA